MALSAVAGIQTGAGPRTAAAPGRIAAGGLRIGLLGTFTINGRPGALRPAQGQLLVALALRGREGAPNQRLCELLGDGPDDPRPSASLRQLLARTRRRIGTAPDGGEWIRHLGSGIYALHPDASVDWHEFESLARAGLAGSDARALARALALVRGQPLAGCYYWWLDVTVVESMRARIVAVASRLAALAVAERDPGTAAAACWAGLAADATSESLWRSLMRAREAAGDLAGVRQAWDRCLAAIAEVAPGGQPHPRTAALYRELLTVASAHHRDRAAGAR